MNKEIKLNFTIWNELQSALARQANDYEFMGDEVTKKQWRDNELAFKYLKSVAKPSYYKKIKEALKKQNEKFEKTIKQSHEKINKMREKGGSNEN